MGDLVREDYRIVIVTLANVPSQNSVWSLIQLPCIPADASRNTALRILEQKRRYRRLHHEEILEKNRRYRELHRDEIAAKQRRRREREEFLPRERRERQHKQSLDASAEASI